MKKRSEATQTLHASCSKADPQTNTQTDRGDYNTLHSLVHSVIIFTNRCVLCIRHIIYQTHISQWMIRYCIYASNADKTCSDRPSRQLIGVSGAGMLQCTTARSTYHTQTDRSCIYYHTSPTCSCTGIRCASGCVVECRICNWEVAGSNLGRGYFASRSTQPSIPPKVYSAFHPSGVGN